MKNQLLTKDKSSEATSFFLTEIQINKSQIKHNQLNEIIIHTHVPD